MLIYNDIRESRFFGLHVVAGDAAAQGVDGLGQDRGLMRALVAMRARADAAVDADLDHPRI